MFLYFSDSTFTCGASPQNRQVEVSKLAEESQARGQLLAESTGPDTTSPYGEQGSSSPRLKQSDIALAPPSDAIRGRGCVRSARSNE